MRSAPSGPEPGAAISRLTRGAMRAVAILCTLAFGSGVDALAQDDVLRLARRRHAAPDTSLNDYRARLNTLVSVGFISDPLAPPKLMLASELASRVAWARGGGLQVEMLGQRYVTSFGPDAEAGLDFSEPWFVTTTPGDSLRLLGGIEIPGRAAVHPFSAAADRYYRYEIGDTVALLVPGRRVELIEIRAIPTRGDEALVVGSLWVDAETGDVGALQIRFVGKPLWADEDDPEGSAWANRILSVSASLQQGLWESRYWLPHRQELELMVRVPLIGNFALPVVFRSDFGRYTINGREPIAWLSPDSLRRPGQERRPYEGATLSLRAGSRDLEPVDSTEADAFPRREAVQVRAGYADGGWEIIRPPDDSLTAYADWHRPLDQPASELTLPSAEELERRARQLAPEIAGRKMFAIQYDRLPELIRYNRVESLGLGLAGRWDLPRRPFWSIGGSLGFGVADLEPKGKLDLRYDAPGTRVALAGYSELHSAGSTLTDDKRAYGGLFRALLLGRDDADYYRASGAALRLGKRWGRLATRFGVGFEDHASVERNTQISIPRIWEDSVFRLNPPADEGSFWRGDLQATLFLGDWTRPTDRVELVLGLELGSDTESLDYLQPRSALAWRLDLADLAAVALRARAAWTAGGAPLQRLWRLGGLSSVRGFAHGTRAGDSYWSAQLEISPRRRAITPVAFADFGWAGPTDDWPGQDAIWSLGAGASLLWGTLRIDLVLPELDDFWLELYLGGAL